MASIFEVIEGLTVTHEDIIEAELFSEQYLSAQFPTYDFRQGTALRDMTVRPNATLLALVNKAIQKYFDDTDIINITNESDKDAVDARMSNFFITRKTGENSVISARLHFTFPTGKPITTIIPVSAYFSIDNETKFYPQGNISVYADETEGEYYFRYDASKDQWYVDINLESESPSEDADIETGDLLYFTVFSPYFLSAQVQYLISKSILEETNEEMVERSYSAISTRNLINTPSIISRISDQFNYVRTVYPVGLGHEWLYRDLIDIQDVNDSEIIHTYHRGGHTDVYLETDTLKSTVQLTAVQDPDVPDNAAFYVTGPIYDIVRSMEPPAGADEDTVPLYLDPANPDLGLSGFNWKVDNVSAYVDSIPTTPEQDIGLSALQIIKITPNLYTISPGDTATFTFSVFQGIDGVHTNMKSINERVVAADYLARSFEPVFIDIYVDLRGYEAEDTDLAYNNVRKLIQDIPNGGTLYMSDVITTLINSGITDFVLPMDVVAHTYPRDPEGNVEGNTNSTSEVIVDKKDILDIQKFYLRDIYYNEAYEG